MDQVLLRDAANVEPGERTGVGLAVWIELGNLWDCVEVEEMRKGRRKAGSMS